MDKHTVKTERAVYSYIRSNHMFDNCKHIITGVSGGADSVCLLLMLCDYVKKYQPDVCIHAVHVNHMIRQEASSDEEFTKKLCEKYGVDCYVEHIDCVGIARKNNLTVEEAGRLERYRIFNEIAKKYAYDGKSMISVAHHMNDQAETVIMNMARGTSLKGVRGIVPVRDNICRPLLCITRSQIEGYLTARGQSYVTDITNYDNDYTRNAIRNVILPYMCEHINKRAVNNISSMAEDIREADEYIDRQTDRLYEECVYESIQDHKETGGNNNEIDIIRIALDKLNKADMLLVKRVIYKCLVRLAGRAKDIYSVNVADIAALSGMQTGKKIHSVYGIQAEREYDYIVLKKNITDLKDTYKAAVDISSLDVNGEALKISIDKDIYIAGYGEKYVSDITFSLVDKKISFKNDENTETSGKILINKSNNVYAKYYDYDKINKLLDIRFRKPQDDIVVSKDGSTKKLKKELVDRKIPSAYRDSVLLVCDKNHVLWACGVRRCESCLVDDETSCVLQILINMKERN